MVSVIMPTLNREKTIKRAIESVLRQSYNDWELIVVDDGSTDNAICLVKKLQEKEPRIILTQNKGVHGVSGARNAGIDIAKGNYIAFLDSDDEWTEKHLEECVLALAETGYGLCSALWIEEKYGEVTKIGENGWYNYIFNDMQEKLNVNRYDKLWKFDKRLFAYIIMTDFYCFHINTVVVAKDLLLQVGKFDENMNGSEDLDLVYRLLQVTSLVTVNRYHFIYHFGQDNLYAFINHNMINVKQLLMDKVTVQKFCRHLKYKIVLIERMKLLLQDYETSQDKILLMKRLDFYLYNRMMTYSFICRKTFKIQCLAMLFTARIKYGTCREKDESVFHPFSKYREKHLYLD